MANKRTKIIINKIEPNEERILAARDELFEYIDRMTITNSQYDVLEKLIENTEDQLFVKIIEELKNENLNFSDFLNLLEGTYFYNHLEKSIDNQGKIYSELSNLILTAKDLKVANIVNYTANLVSLYEKRDDDGNIIEKISDIEKETILSTFFTDEQKDPSIQFYMDLLLKDLLLDPTKKHIDDILLSLNEFVVPVDLRYVQLNEADLLYAQENNLTEDEMKKIKSLAAYDASLTIDPKNQENEEALLNRIDSRRIPPNIRIHK